ncbi:copper amine oxidase N-terminal domain-containing protein [Paenibacillus lutimineralis]|uniref:Copper amine oxidase N-terminal domain-containing protein n=1 Tax=Paenibacillus lutimineralis TaxID=2707005 RepID=A0A3S9UX90_9BACL|nr:copper amine oxidase N-terminal domain-containing protein [Paenibacillus lutimineralis]AZS14707.1 copper amine oxidase N-terminal domain-containing protein [Paenibacillus lutimineralis]
MNFKKLIITTIIIASQLAMVIPVSAEEAAKQDTVSAVQQQSTVTSNNLGANEATTSNSNATNPGQEGQVTNEDSTGQDTSVTGENGKTEGTGDNSGAEEGQTEQPTGTDEGQDADGSNSSTTNPATTTNATAGAGQLVLMMNSNKMYQGGKEYIAGYPMEVKNGVSYVSIRAIVERAGLQLSFDNKTKETIISRGNDELRFKLDTSNYRVNGVVTPMKGKSYSAKNNFMVPLTAITKALGIPYTVDNVGKRVILNLSTKPVASFSIGNKEVIAGETDVQYLTNSYSPSGLEIVNEEWTGRQDKFTDPGTYTVTYRVQDSNGQWSDPFSLKINVGKPHTPPLANFMTDKDTYKMGELITYTDLSSDEVGIKELVWENNERAFFTPGQMTIRLKVVNVFGLSSTVERTITITNETLYNRDDFNKLFTPVGEKYAFDGTSVPSWERVNYSISSDPVTLIRSNSPETVYSEGRVYKETASGAMRFMVHHVNSTGKNMKMYVVATNKNETTARLTQNSLGFGGPSQYATAAGKVSVERYYKSLQTGGQYKDVWIAPGESKVIMPELNATTMKQGDVISLFADMYSDQSLEFNVIMIDPNKDPLAIAQSPSLPNLKEDVHNRGTYEDSTRYFQYNDLVGTTRQRLLIGDNSNDPFQVGYDGITNAYKLNAGNFGMLYKIKLYRVAPNTLITFNPRGGRYSGSIMVNGDIVQLSTGGSLSAPNDANVLFRTGDREQTVEFVFTAAPGSNLSVNLLLQPLPEAKQ